MSVINEIYSKEFFSREKPSDFITLDNSLIKLKGMKAMKMESPKSMMSEEKEKPKKKRVAHKKKEHHEKEEKKEEEEKPKKKRVAHKKKEEKEEKKEETIKEVVKEIKVKKRKGPSKVEKAMEKEMPEVMKVETVVDSTGDKIPPMKIEAEAGPEVKKMGSKKAPAKGSEEAKAWGQMMREMRMKKKMEKA